MQYLNKVEGWGPCLSLSISYIKYIRILLDYRGIWNVPHIYGIYLIQRSIIENPLTRPSFIYRLLDPDIAMATNFRNNVRKIFKMRLVCV